MRTVFAILIVCLLAVSPAFAQQEIELYRFTWDNPSSQDPTEGWGTEHMLGGVVSGWGIVQADVTDAYWEDDPKDLAAPAGPDRYVNLDGIDLDKVAYPYGGVFPRSGGSLNLLKDSLVYEGWVGPRLSSFSSATWWNRKTLKRWLVENRGVDPNAIITKIQFNVTSGPRPNPNDGFLNVDFWFAGTDSGAVTGSRIRKANLDAWGSLDYNPIKWNRTTYKAADIQGGQLIQGSASIQSVLGDLNGLVGITFSNVQPDAYYGKFIDDVTVFGIIAPPATSAAEAQSAPSGCAVEINEAVVSDNLVNVPHLPAKCLYIQDGLHAPSGIRIVGAPNAFDSIVPGDRLQVTGTIAKVNGENEIRVSGWSLLSRGEAPKPYAMSNKAFAGMTGLAPHGIKARTFGKVIAVDPAEKYILISDGSGVTQMPGSNPIKNGSFDDYAPGGHWQMPDEWKTVSFPDLDLTWNRPSWFYINPPTDPTDPDDAIWGTLPHSGRGWIGAASQNPNNSSLAGGYQIIENALVPGETYSVEAYGLALHNGTGQAKVRIGVDPNGGTDANSSTVIWGDYIVSPADWTRTEVQFFATGANATVYLQMNQLEAMKCTTCQWPLTATCIDDVKLVMEAPEGMKVYCDFGANWPAVGSYVGISGIVGAEQLGSNTNPVLWAKPASKSTYN